MDVQRPATRPSPGDPLADPIPRRRMLLLLGAGILATGSGLGVLLEACANAAPVKVTLQVNPATLQPGLPVEVPFSITNASGATVPASTWLLKNADGSFTAYDPRCTHAQCRYKWAAAEGFFKCNCHGGAFALDGTVLTGPPPRPLDKFPLSASGGVLIVDVPASFTTPKESLGA